MSYGPSSRELVTVVIVLLLIGVALGIGGLRGCEYLAEHVRIEWK